MTTRCTPGLVFIEQAMKMNLGRVFTPEEATMLFQMITACNDAGGETGFSKVLLPNAEKAEFIGMGAIDWNDEYNAYEIEYMLLSDYWHQGYGTALVERLLKRAEEARAKGGRDRDHRPCQCVFAKDTAEVRLRACQAIHQ